MEYWFIVDADNHPLQQQFYLKKEYADNIVESYPEYRVVSKWINFNKE